MPLAPRRVRLAPLEESASRPKAFDLHTIGPSLRTLLRRAIAIFESDRVLHRWLYTSGSPFLCDRLNVVQGRSWCKEFLRRTARNSPPHRASKSLGYPFRRI